MLSKMDAQTTTTDDAEKDGRTDHELQHKKHKNPFEHNKIHPPSRVDDGQESEASADETTVSNSPIDFYC